MTASLLLSLLLQAGSILAVRLVVKGDWWRHPFTYLLFTAFAYTVLSDSLLRIPSLADTSPGRSLIAPEYFDRSLVVQSLAMASMTFGYLLAYSPTNPQDSSVTITQNRVRLDWRVLLGLSLFLIAVSATRYIGSDGVYTASSDGLLTGLVPLFLIPTTVFASLALILRFGNRWIPLVVLGQSALLAVSNQRTAILVALVALIVILLQLGVKVTRRQVIVAAGVFAIMFVALTGVRATEGREAFDTNPSAIARISSVFGNVGAFDSLSDESSSAVATLTRRLDSNEFGAAVEQAFAEGNDLLPPVYLALSFAEALPSFFFNSKLEMDPSLRNPESGATMYYNLANTDYLPGHFGLFLPVLGNWLMPVFFFFAGLVFSRLEKFALARITFVRLIVLLILTQAVMYYEVGLPGVVVSLRGGIAILAIALFMSVWSRRAGGSARRLDHTQSLNMVELNAGAALPPNPPGVAKHDLAAG